MVAEALGLLLQGGRTSDRVSSELDGPHKPELVGCTEAKLGPARLSGPKGIELQARLPERTRLGRAPSYSRKPLNPFSSPRETRTIQREQGERLTMP